MIKIFLFSLDLICNLSAFAGVTFLPRSVDDLRFSGKKGVVDLNSMAHVEGAEVAYANYEALKRDFPEIRHYSEKQIQEWILKNFAYVSKTQLKLNNLRQTPVPISPHVEKKGYRPIAYNRADVIPALDDQGHSIGLVDVKGTGIKEGGTKYLSQINQFKEAQGNQEKIDRLRVSDHSDGLMSLGEAIAELTRERATKKIFDIENVKNKKNLQTVESYFIIHLPFQILKEGSRTIPAALYGRQAHLGRSGSASSVHPYTTVKQQDFFGAYVDFGDVQIKHPALSQNPHESFGRESNSQESNAWKWGHQVALAWTRKPDPDKDAIERHLREMLGPIESEWNSIQSQIVPSQPFKLKEAVLNALVNDPQRLYESVSEAMNGKRNEDLDSFVEHILKTGKEPEKVGIAFILAKYNTPRREEFLSLAQKSESAAVRTAVIRGFSSGVSDEKWNPIPFLLQAFKDPNREIRLAAAEALACNSEPKARYLKEPGYFEVVTLGLSHEDPEIRTIFARALAFFWNHIDPPHPELEKKLFLQAINDSDPRVVNYAIASLDEPHPDIAIKYTIALTHPNPEVREKMFHFLTTKDQRWSQSQAAWLELFEELDPKLRNEVIKRMPEEWKKKVGLPKLLKMMHEATRLGEPQKVCP